jgi:hypothetical protein
MKGAFKLLTSVVRKLLQKELESTAGKVNLLGGIISVVLIVLAFADNVGINIVNFILSVFGKGLLPQVGSIYVLISVALVPLYFICCVLVISKE